MQINVEYVQGEDRDGFYVQPMMKRRWAVEVDMLKEIERICRCYNIKYFGWYGTLLGAVRHKGFIPWDDDLDLAMLREDYEKFQYICRTELPDGWVISRVNPCLTCVKNSDTIRLDQRFLDRHHGYPLITGIDIFCLDHIPRDKTNENAWLEMFFAVYVLFKHWDNFKKDRQWEEGKWEQLREIEKITGVQIDRLCPVKEQLYALLEKIAAVYWDTESDEVANIPRLYVRREHRIPKPCFDQVIEVPFEDTVMPVLKDNDLVCKVLYGDDYMVPIREQGHDCIKEQMDILKRYFEDQGVVLPECFRMSFE